MKKVLFALIFISSVGLYAQDIEENQDLESIDTLAPKVKRLSVGLKIGMPNIAGLSVRELLLYSTTALLLLLTLAVLMLLTAILKLA